MEKTGRKALFQDAPSNGGSDGGNEILGDWAKILKSAVEGDTSARINIDSVGGSLKSLGETLNLAIEKISADSDDIDNKKRLIGNAQKRYREIVQQNPMPMLLINKEFKVVVTNPAYEEMSGYTRDELRKMNLRDFHVEGKAGDGIRKALSAGIRSTGEVVVNLPSGTHTLEQHCIPVRNDANEITNVLLAYQDLTDLRQEMAETNLLKKQAELFIKQNPQAIAVLGPDKSRIDLNKEYERVWRGSYEELMRKKLYDFDITMTGGEDFYASYETKRLAVSDMELKWPNGEKTYVTLYQVPILDDNGDILVNYYIYQDRTAEIEEKGAIELLQKQSEAFIKQNPQAITVLGPDKSRIDLNKEYERVWRGSYEELMRKKLYDFDITMTGGDDFYASYETKRLAISEMTLNWQNGEKTYVTLYQVPILDDNGDILVNYYIYQDRTAEIEEKRAIQLLQKQSESFIKENPQAIAVLGPDKSRIDLNKEYERVWRGSYEELMRKKLYDFDITMTGGEDFYASYETKRLAVTNMELKWPNGDHTYVTLYQVPILDEKGDILVNYYIYQDLTKDVSVEKYLSNEVEKLKAGLEAFAHGDLTFNASVDEGNEYTTVVRENFIQISGSINGVRDAVGAVLMDVGQLAEAAVEGRLDTRADARAHNGEFAKVVEGVNDTLDAVIGPLNVAAEYVDRISKGDIPEKIADDMQGDFNEIKNNLNQCIDAVNLLVNDAGMLASAAAMEEFSTRADATKHNGDFRKIVDGMNQTFDGVAGKLYLYESSIDAIPFPVSVTDLDMNWIFFNKAVTDLTGLRREDMLGKQCSNWNADICNTARCGVQMLRKGELTSFFKQPGMDMDMRVDTQYIQNAKGENIGHIEIVQDITAANRVAEFQKQEVGRVTANLAEIAKGNLNIDTTVTEADKYTAEVRENFVQIKGALDETVRAVGLMLNDAGMLAEAAVEGKLDTRADVSRHQGDYAKIVIGINDTMDAMAGPLNVATDFLDGIAAGSKLEEITGDYRGDYARIKDSANECYRVLNALLNEVFGLTEAGMAGNLDVRGNVENYGGAWSMVVGGINDTMDAMVGPLNVTAEYVDRISKGDIPEKITDDYQGDFNEIKNNLNACIDGLGGLVEANAVMQKMAVNDFSAEVEGNYLGVFAEVATATNVVRKILVHIQSISGNIAKGDLKDLAVLKNQGKRSENDQLIPSFIGMMDNIQAVVDDANMLAKAGVNGQLGVRADATGHSGAYGAVISGFNNTLDAIGAPLQETMGVLERMAVNDYTTKVENEYPGDYAKLTNNLNEVLGRLMHVQDTLQNIAVGDLSDLNDYKTLGKRSKNDMLNPSFIGMIENIQAVVSDAEMLAEAGVNGQLDVRADASRHAGAYGDVIGGINNTLDAVVGPLNVTAEYVDRISKGDIPEKITKESVGDFNEIKNNLNQCIDAVNLLVIDTNMLVDAAAAGRLTARADVSHHTGDFAKIVGGINQTLDIINAPFREVNAAIAQLDITADETSRGADEIGKAAEQVAVTSQMCADLSTSLINQIEAVDRQIADLSASNEEIASTSQEVHEHAVQTARIGERAQQLGAEANTKMNNVEIIAKQSVDEINTLNSRMQEIDNVVKQVNDITNQINLLALNAAIEAARAGEHGRGFAVVAGEVRNLAEEAKQATGQIDQVIAGVQAISAKTAEGIGSAHAEIGSGVVSVNETIEALNEIVQGSQDMKVNIDEIAKAIEEQANMANRIVEAMEESGRLTRENQGQVEELASLAEEASASTEEIGSSIHEVKNMADDLKKTMDRFEV